MNVNPLHAEIAKLREALDERDAEIANFREMTADTILFPADWGLDPTDRRLLATFLKSKTGFCRRAFMRIACTDDEDTSEKITDVRICRLRAKLKLLGVEIETINGEGWRMAPSEQSKINKLLAPAPAPVNLPMADLVACALVTASRHFDEDPEKVATGQVQRCQSRAYAAKLLMREINLKGSHVARSVGFKSRMSPYNLPNFDEKIYDVIKEKFLLLVSTRRMIN